MSWFATSTWLIDRLEEHGLVQLHPDPHDRRVKRVVLTDEGARVHQQVIDELYQPTDAFSQLDPGQLHAARALTAVLHDQDPSKDVPLMTLID